MCNMLGGLVAKSHIEDCGLAAGAARQFERLVHAPRWPYNGEACFRQNLCDFERQKRLVLDNEDAGPLAQVCDAVALPRIIVSCRS